MYAKILTNIPASGDTPEIHFGDHFQYPLWIEFMDHNNEKWYGCFSSDYPVDDPHTFNKVLLDPLKQTAFVVVGGFGYLVDLNNRQIKLKYEEHPLITCIFQSHNPDYFITANSLCINIFNSEEWIKRVIPNLLTNNIFFTDQISTKILGNLTAPEIDHDTPLDFELDLITFEFKTNSPI